MNLWHFSKDEDPDARPYEPADARSVQPDHYPNVMRPGGGYPEGKGHKTDAFCNSCDDQLVDGSCLRCDWGPTNRSEPIKNFPIDPFEDDKAGIRAGSWKFAMSPPPLTSKTIYQRALGKGPKKKEDPLYQALKNQNLIISSPDFIKEKNDVTQRGLGAFKAEEVECRNCNNFVTIANLKNPKCPICNTGRQKPLTPQSIYERLKTKNDPLHSALVKQKLTIPSADNIKRSDRLGTGLSSYMAEGVQCGNCNSKDAKILNLGRPTCNTCNTHKTLKVTNILNNSKNKAFIVSNFEKIYEKIQRWGESYDGKKMDDQYVQVVKRIPGLEKISPFTIFKWWDKQEEKLKISGQNPLKNFSELMENNQFKNRLQELVEAKTSTEEYGLYGQKAIYDQLIRDFPELKSKLEEVGFKNFERYFNQVVEDQGWNRLTGKGSFNEEAPAIVYAFQQGSSIKVGIANVMDERIKEYEEQRRPSTLRPLKDDGRSKELKFYLPTIKYPTDRRQITTNPDDEKLLMERGLNPIAETKEKVVRPSRSRPRDRRRMIVKRPDLFPKATAKQGGVAYESEPIPGRMAAAIEANIMNWWISLNLSPVLTEAHYTETISADTSKAIIEGMDIGPDLTLELHVFLIEKMIENGGHMDKLDEVFARKAKEGSEITGQDQLLNFFDNDQNKLAAAFGVSYDPETQQYGVGGNLLGDAIFPEGVFPTAKSEVQAPVPELMTQRQKSVESWGPTFDRQPVNPYAWNYEQENSEFIQTPPPNIALPDSIDQLPSLAEGERLIQNQAYRTYTPNEARLVDDKQQEWVITYPDKTFKRVAKTSSYQGWSNWETWNTKLMIDNEYDLYMESRRIVEERRPIEQFATWATQAVIAPHNQSALADAQEWNETPYEERPTGREDMPEGARDLIEGIEGIFGDDPREDATAEIIDESKVNWNEIYNSIGEDIKESEARAHEGGEHELPMEQYTGYTSEELIEAKADQHPWCPLCNPENPDAPGDLTIPDDWTGF